MKKIMIFAAAAALLSLSSCGKEEIKNVTDASSNGSPVFTASINPGTKTTVNAQYGTLAWENSDVITITDAAENIATYYISGIDGSTGKATFEYSSGDELGAGPYSAVYGEQPEEEQTYSATAPGKLPMSAYSTENVLTFTVQCALMEINLTKDGESVKKIEVTGKPDGKEETTYTLTCTEAVSIAEQKSFYIALPAGTYTKIVITDSEDKVCTLNVKAGGIPVTVNQIIPATFDAGHLDFLPKGALPGVFSVGPNATDKVHFSQGNLVATIDASASPLSWSFAVNQYDYQGTGGANTTIGSKPGFVDLFDWSTDATKNNWGIHTKTNATQDYTTGSFKDWGKAYCEKNSITPDNTWRTLSIEEWQYLFAWNSTLNSGRGGFDENLPRYGLFNCVVTVCGKTNCVVLLPDNWEWDETADEHNVGTGWQTEYPETSTESNPVTWEKMEKAGAVCLPAAGGRNIANVANVGNLGFYWSSTAMDNKNAYRVNFTSSDVTPGKYSARNLGHSVRLITESN